MKDESQRDPLSGLLDEMAEFERAVIEDSETPVGDVADESRQVRAWIEAERGAGSPPRGWRRTWIPFGIGALAAAILIFANLGWFEPSQPEHQGDPIAVGLQLVPIAPIGAASFERFEWSLSGSLPLNSYFRLELRTADGTPLGAPIEDLRTSFWNPEQELRDQWPGSIEWRVSVVRGDTLTDASQWTAAHR